MEPSCEVAPNRPEALSALLATEDTRIMVDGPAELRLAIIEYFIESDGEQRYQLIGMTKSLALLLVVFVDRSARDAEVIHPISARRAVDYPPGAHDARPSIVGKCFVHSGSHERGGPGFHTAAPREYTSWDTMFER